MKTIESKININRTSITESEHQNLNNISNMSFSESKIAKLISNNQEVNTLSNDINTKLTISPDISSKPNNKPIINNKSLISQVTQFTQNTANTENTINKTSKEKPVRYSRKSRYVCFMIFMITNLVMNMDHGIIPAVTTEIKHDLDIGEAMLGVFGSMVYVGNLLGKTLFNIT